MKISRTYGEKKYRRQSNRFNSQTNHKKPNSYPQIKAGSSMQTKQYQTNNFSASTSKARQPSNAKGSEPLSGLVTYLLRLTIVGVGLGAIVGTALTNIDLTKPLFPPVNKFFNFAKLEIFKQEQGGAPPPAGAAPLEVVEAKTPATEAVSGAESVSFKQELPPLAQKFAELKTKYANLEPGAFFVDVDNGSFVNFNGTSTFSAASTIKIPVLIAFFQDVDAGKIHLDEKLTMDGEVVAAHAGTMQYQPKGTKFTALETATNMIVISDNTATNMLIRRLGGAEALNQRFREWGLEVTAIRNPLPDLEGTNTTSPKDLAYLLAKVDRGELVSVRSRDRILDITRQTKTKTLLPQGLEKDAVIAHKTGDIGTSIGDAGIIDMATGKRYIGAVLVRRPHNDSRARILIQEISRTAYQHFKWYLPRPPLSANKE